MKRRGEEGWTFMETIIVIAIVLILSSTVGYVAVRNIPRSRVAAAKSQIDSFSAALESFYIDCGRYPNEEEGLAALWAKPDSAEGWAGPYLVKKIPKDPWGHEYVYRNPGAEGFPYGILSYGEDGKEGGADHDADLGSWDG
ncbi:MAG: type II secretion system major pseudopilin GspG [Treponema sp.]|jgi:general secretion pathway protein G|nr:type II secretion system major pseudopilin GspG [Treponema sp.]